MPRSAEGGHLRLHFYTCWAGMAWHTSMAWRWWTMMMMMMMFYLRQARCQVQAGRGASRFYHHHCTLHCRNLVVRQSIVFLLLNVQTNVTVIESDDLIVMVNLVIFLEVMLVHDLASRVPSCILSRTWKYKTHREGTSDMTSYISPVYRFYLAVLLPACRRAAAVHRARAKMLAYIGDRTSFWRRRQSGWYGFGRYVGPPGYSGRTSGAVDLLPAAVLATRSFF